MLRAKLWELQELKAAATIGAARSVIGRGMRAKKSEPTIIRKTESPITASIKAGTTSMI